MKFESKFHIFVQENAFEDVVCGMATSLFRGYEIKGPVRIRGQLLTINGNMYEGDHIRL